MKNLKITLAMMIFFAVAVNSFAGNHPALTTPGGTLATSPIMVEVTPWHKGMSYVGGVTTSGAWYAKCPLMGHAINAKRPGVEVTLSNGKRMMVCCTPCKDDAEKDLAKYEIYQY